MAALTFVLPGPIETRTGGFIYDRRIIEGLRDLGHEVEVIALWGDFPSPDAAELQAAEERLGVIADQTLVVVDGLALGCMPELAERLAARAQLVALVHHPLALERGLTPDQMSRLAESERRALRAARAVIVSSRRTASILKEGGWHAGSVLVVEPGTERAPAARGSSGDQTVLLCVATLIPRKGHLVLLEALSELTDLDWRLDLVGAPRDRQTAAEVEAAIEAGALSDRVVLHGELGESALEALYQAADVFVLPSFYEGFGMVITEAVMRGLPVVTTTGGALEETLPNGCGLLSPPGDAKSLRDNLRTVLSQADRRAALRAAARSAREDLPGWGDAAVAFARALEL